MTAGFVTTRLSRALLIAAALFVALVPVEAARAQLDRFDKGQLIDAMRREQMGELLLHFLEIEPPEDPVITRQARVAQLLIEYQRKDARAQRTADETAKASLLAQSRADFDAALAEWRTLIAEHYEHPLRPIWETDLAEQLLYEYLATMKQNAAEFYDYGVVADEQREAFTSTVPEAITVISSADFGFFNRQTELPLEPDHVEARVNTQIWHRMIEVYYKAKTKFFLAHAAYYTALLPDSHAYYRKLDANNRFIRGQLTDPAAERRRLLSLADQSLTDVLDQIDRSGRDDYGIGPSCRALRGRVRSLLATLADPAGEQTEAIEQLTAAAAEPPLGEDRLTPLVARLALARAHERAGDRDAAMDQLTTAQDSSLARDSLFMRLLTVDAEHRTRLRQAEAAEDPAERRRLMDGAYAVYNAVLDNPDLDKDTALSLRNYVYQRWASSVGENADLSATPAMVVLAIGETLRFEAQNLMVEAQTAENNNDPTRAAELTEQARPILDRALKVTGDLVAREDLLPAVRANAMFNHGAALFWAGRKNLGQVIEACDLFTDIAEQYPDQRISEEALSNALSLLGGWHESLQAPNELLLAAYRRAMDVAVEKFRTSTVTADACLAYAKNVLIPRREYERAGEVLLLVPVGHRDYAAAQTALLIALKQWFGETTDAPTKESLALRIEQEAQRIVEDMQRAIQGAGPEQAAILRLAEGTAVLALADIAAARGQFDQAVDSLEDFEVRFADNDELVGEALANRLMYLARSGDFEAVRTGAGDLMERHPQRAAGVINVLLRDLAEEIERLNAIRDNLLEAQQVRDEAEQQARDIAETILELAERLLEWAELQNLPEVQLIPYRLIRARALVLVDRAAVAVPIIEPIHQAYPNDPVILTDMAEAYMQRALQARPVDLDALKTQAAPLFSRLISGLQSQRQPDGSLPDLYWNAWLKYFMILDAVGENTADIPKRVAVLRARHPDLGGERYRVRMEALERKYR